MINLVQFVILHRDIETLDILALNKYSTRTVNNKMTKSGHFQKKVSVRVRQSKQIETRINLKTKATVGFSNRSFPVHTTRQSPNPRSKNQQQPPETLRDTAPCTSKRCYSTQPTRSPPRRPKHTQLASEQREWQRTRNGSHLGRGDRQVGKDSPTRSRSRLGGRPPAAETLTLGERR